jgi:hypothetical protein
LHQTEKFLSRTHLLHSRQGWAEATSAITGESTIADPHSWRAFALILMGGKYHEEQRATAAHRTYVKDVEGRTAQGDSTLPMNASD